MKSKNNTREKILNQPSYWVEGINSFLYNAILEYMEINNMNRTELAKYFGISKGRISQILNDGEINFSIEKVVQIALKIDKFPVFEFKDKQEYLKSLTTTKYTDEIVVNYENNKFSQVNIKANCNTKIIPLFPNNEFSQQLAL